MKNTDRLQSSLLGAYLAESSFYMASPFVGSLATYCVGKWASLAAILDRIAADGGEPTSDAVIQWMIANPYEGGVESYIKPEEVMDLAGAKSEQTVRGYEQQLADWNRQRKASQLIQDTLKVISPDNGVSDPSPAIATLIESFRHLDTAAGADVNTGQGLDEAIAAAQQASANRVSGVVGALWGVPALDHLIPLEPGSMYILAAAPKCGKTSLAMTAAQATSDAGGMVAFASLEMRASALSEIMASRALGFDARAFRRGMLPAEEMAMVGTLADEWKKQDRILVRDTRADRHRCEDIKNWVKLRQRMRGDLSLVIVDYLQLMESSNPRATEYETVTKNTRTLKLMANSLNVPVLVLSQMNREGRKQQMSDGRKAGQVEPTMGSLRSSGSIEQDADAVCFLWSENEPTPGETTRKVEFKVEANRRGECGRVPLSFYGPTQTFTSAITAPSDRGPKLRSPPSDREDLF